MTYYFAQNATVEVREPGSARFKVVGAAQEVSIDTEFEVEELYQFGSILRTTAARHHASINVKVSTAQFGSFADDAAWFWKVLNSAGVTDIEDTTTFGSGKQVTISDTTNLPMFSIAGEWTSDDGSEIIYGRVDGVYFKNFSWGGALGEYIIEELEGTGSQVTFTNNKKYGAGSATENVWSSVAPRVSTGGIESVMGEGEQVSTPTAGNKLIIPLDNYKQYTSVKATIVSMPTFTDGSTTDSPCIYVDATTKELPIEEPATGSTQATIIVIHKTPTSSGSTNPACTCVVNIVADGLSKQIPVEFTSAITSA